MSDLVASPNSDGYTLARARSVLWYAALLTTALGVVALGARARLLGLTTVTIGGGTLSLLSLATELRIVLRADDDQFVKFSIVATGAAVFVTATAIALGIFPVALQPPVRIVVITLGLQALLLTVDVRPVGATQRARVFLLMASHVAVFAGSLLVLPFGPTDFSAAVLMYSVGFSFLILHAFWMRRLRPGVSPPRPETRRRYWESLLLVAILVGIAATIGFVTTTRRIAPTSPLSTVLATIVGLAATMLLASLSVPRTPPDVLAHLAGPLATIVQHVLTLMALVNTLFFALFLALPPAFSWGTGLFLILLALGVSMNYLMLARSRVRSTADPSLPASVLDDTPFTVVITAMNESNVLRETLPRNLTELPGIDFLVVPAAESDDGTQTVLADIAAEHGDRLRVIEGTAGSKAGDLNQVWPHVDTPFVLVLDADERVRQDAVSRGLQILLSNPDMGIVQGRKVATHPDLSNLSQFATVERQHSTWIDHPFVDHELKAGHFAGSSAVLRHSVVSDLGGFETAALTEDIELTIRMYTETDWNLRYVPGMVFSEYNPGTWTSLIRQRERWARGWSQVAARYFPTVLRNTRRLGWRRTAGLSWELFLAVSSPVYTLFPAIIAYWAVFGGPPFPLWLLLSLTVVMLPERGLSFLYAAFRDPAISRDVSIRGVFSTLLHAYLWLPFGWVIQLHSLYLQLAGAVERWEVTEKATMRAENSDST